MPTSVRASWSRIVAWLRSNAPAALEKAQGPASAEEVARAAAQMGAPWPDDLREFYQLTNGAESSGVFPSCDEWDDMAFSPLSLDQAVYFWRMQKNLLEMGEFADSEPRSDAGVANVWWNVGWIPFADNGGGDCYCVDHAPTGAGVQGQVISHSHESGKHAMLARSLADYLSNLADSLESNTLEYDDDYGLRKIATGE